MEHKKQFAIFCELASRPASDKLENLAVIFGAKDY